MPPSRSSLTGYFGPIYTEFRGDAKGAVKRLMEAKTGEAVAALHHKDVGDIDLVWGKEGTPEKGYEDGYGLAKIVEKHAEVVGRLQEVIDGAKVEAQSAGYVRLISPEYKAIVRLDWNREQKTWLLTAYKTEDSSHTRGRAGVSGNKGGAPPAPRDGSYLNIPPSPAPVKPVDRVEFIKADARGVLTLTRSQRQTLEIVRADGA